MTDGRVETAHTSHAEFCSCSLHISMRARHTAWLKTYESSFVSRRKESLFHLHVTPTMLHEYSLGTSLTRLTTSVPSSPGYTLELTLEPWNVVH